MDEIHNLSFKASLFAVTGIIFFICSDSISFLSETQKGSVQGGADVPPSNVSKSVCQVSITKRLLQLFPPSRESSSPLVRRIVKSKSKEYFHATKGVSYTTLEEEFRIEIC